MHMKKRKRRKADPKKRFMKICGIILFLVVIYGLLYSASEKRGNGLGIFSKLFPTQKVGKPAIEEQFLTPNEYSRPGVKLRRVKGIVVHYTANPGSSAKNNRNYFQGLKDSKETYASSHFIIGLEGEIIQCIPLEEISYASNKRNIDTISIECCHQDETGKFTEKTYRSLVKLVAWLCGKYNLKQDDIIRHYDVTQKICPKYFVDHEDAWDDFKDKVFAYIEAFHN